MDRAGWMRHRMEQSPSLANRWANRMVPPPPCYDAPPAPAETDMGASSSSYGFDDAADPFGEGGFAAHAASAAAALDAQQLGQWDPVAAANAPTTLLDQREHYFSSSSDDSDDNGARAPDQYQHQHDGDAHAQPLQPFQSIHVRAGRRRDDDFGFTAQTAPADGEPAFKRARGNGNGAAPADNSAAAAAALAAAYSSSSAASRKRFSKAHQTSADRAVVPTEEVREHVAAAAAEPSPPATATAAPALPDATPSTAAAAASDHDAAPGLSRADAFIRDIEAGAMTTKPKRRKRKSAEQSEPARSAAAASSPQRPSRASSTASSNAAPAAAAAPVNIWSNSLPSSAHFRAPPSSSNSTSSSALLSQGSELAWARDFGDSTIEYTAPLIEQRIDQLKRHLRRQGINVAAGTSTWANAATPPVIAMALAVLLRQPRLTAQLAVNLFSSIEIVLRENLLPTWLSTPFQTLLYRVAPLLPSAQQGELQALLALVQERHANDAYLQALRQPPMGGGTHVSPRKMPAVLARPAMSFGGAQAQARARGFNGPLHGGEQPQKCPFCPVVMLSLGALHEHARQVHRCALPGVPPAGLVFTAVKPVIPQMPPRRSAAPVTGPGSSASDAIALDDDDSSAPITAGHVVANQRLSVSAAREFIAASFLADEFVSSVKLPLVDPLTLARIVVPVRSKRCDHVRCFDLDTILMQAAHAESRNKKLTCPIDHLEISLADLVVDSFMQDRIKEATNRPDDCELILKRDGSFEFTLGAIASAAAAGGNGGGMKRAVSDGAAATSGAPVAASAASSNGKAARVVHTVDLLDSDEEESVAAPVAAPKASSAPLRSAATAPPPPPQPMMIRSVTDILRGAFDDDDDDDESSAIERTRAGDGGSDGSGQSRSSTPMHHRAAFSPGAGADNHSAHSASSSRVSSPAPANFARRSGGAMQYAPAPSSYPIPRSAWDTQPQQFGHARFASSLPNRSLSGSSLRPSAPGNGVPIRRRVVAEIDLTLSSDTEQSDAAVSPARHCVQARHQGRSAAGTVAGGHTTDEEELEHVAMKQQPDDAAAEDEDSRTAALAMLRQQADTLLMPLPDDDDDERMHDAPSAAAAVVDASTTAAAAAGSSSAAAADPPLNLDAFSPELMQLQTSSPLQRSTDASSDDATREKQPAAEAQVHTEADAPLPQPLPAEVPMPERTASLEIIESPVAAAAAAAAASFESVPVHPPSLHSLEASAAGLNEEPEVSSQPSAVPVPAALSVDAMASPSLSAELQ